jgi:protein-tyrosine phosphatase
MNPIKAPLKILMVCLGNICRSPIAHGILQHKVKLHNLNWEIDSAGTSNYHQGELPDRRAVACMKRHHIDITYQRSRPIVYKDFFYYDLILVMDKQNLRDVQQMAKTNTDKAKIALVMSMADEGYPEEEVPDPYYSKCDSGFEMVYEMLDKATDALIRKYA